MKKIIALFFMLAASPHSHAQDDNFDQYPVYTGDDLGVHYTPQKTSFTTWSPEATDVVLRIYKAGSGGEALQNYHLQKGINGSWHLDVDGDQLDLYYTFQFQHNGKWLEERPDIYARAVGINGARGMIVDLSKTNPPHWKDDKRVQPKNPTDIIIYETHVRDISIASNSGMKNKGRFIAFTESGTKGPGGLATGLDHLKELGITHVHLLPSFDFNSVDETKPDAKYNWGYDPLNYNVPEGSFSTDAYDGNVRIREFKQMVQALHNNNIGVILDVVYNHTSGINSNFNNAVPGYFYRHKPGGAYADATGCGNETASERAMMRKFMIESVTYWAKEYHLDGFRFDLMGVHDITTMNAISDALHAIDPAIFIYGEGWTAGASPLPESQRAVKKNTSQLKNIAAFGDELRDAIRGPFSNEAVSGFAGDNAGKSPGVLQTQKESIMFGIVAATQHPQVNYSLVNYSKEPWAAQPSQAINYVSCHDDATLFDRLKHSNPKATEGALIKMDKLANTVVFTSQGVAFLHSGAEMLRTKKGVSNSYNSPDSINQIDWSRKVKYNDVYQYYKGLVALRKTHPAFRMPTTDMIREHLAFIETNDPLLIAYTISNHANDDEWKDILIVLNGDAGEKKFTLPAGEWQLAVDGNTVSEKGIRKLTGAVIVPSLTPFVLFRK